ncbi:replication protein O [Shewanella phage vB_SbaS_Y11]|nr:replication protein O [Shewanella phage vB_SbaS_Y11]
MSAIKQKVYQMDRFVAKPKWWGKLRHKSRLKNSEYLVLDVIFDKTIDWNKSTDRISISQFQDELGLSNKNVIDSLKSLKKKGLILIMGQERKTNTITIKMASCEKLALTETGEKFSQAKKATGEEFSQDVKTPTGENFSQTGENFTYQLVKNFHTHDTRYHYPIPYIYIKGYLVLADYGVCPKTQQAIDKLNSANEAKSLIEFWNDNHGNGKSSNVKISVWEDKVKARLKKFSLDEIKLAMLGVIQSSWHQQNGQVRIKNAISSDQRCDDAITSYRQQQQRKINQPTGATYENGQSNHQQPLSPFNTEWDTSTTAGYSAKLDADAEAYYASLEAEQGDDRGYQGAF